MKIIKKTLDGLFEIFPKAHLDYRGFLTRIDDKEIFHNADLNAEWVKKATHILKKIYCKRFTYPITSLFRKQTYKGN